MRSHGGTITVDDVKPHGARFVITLTALPASRTAPEEGERMTVPERPTRILVVDDEEQIRRALKSILRTRGYTLDMASTGQRGAA